MEEMTWRLTLGSVRCKQFKKYENGRVVTYGYSINLDRDGIETSRTEPTAISSMGYDKGDDFTLEDYDAARDGRPRKRKGFWRKLIDLVWN